MTSIAYGTPSRGAARNTLLGRASWLAAPALSLLTLLVTGCSANFDPKLTGADPSSSVGALKGNIHGGQAPIYGAAIYVMQTGLSGYPITLLSGPTTVYAAANTSLITSSSGTFTGTVNGTSHGTYVLTDFNGNFTIPGFTCTPGAGVYIYSVGGQPIAGTTNNAATEMAAMGICPAGGASALATSVPFVNVNEVSTVAMAFALGGFEYPGFDATHISSSSTNTVGLANAFGLAADLYSVGTNNGANQSLTVQYGTAVINYQTINTLANILSDCINSNGSTASSSTPCYILFQNATSNGVSGGGTIPTDTASAAINIAHWPQSNVSNLFTLASNSYAPYTPAYSSAPSNFAVGIYYSGSNGNWAYPNGLGMAIDSAGYVYVGGQISSTGTYINGLTKFSPYSGPVGTTASSNNTSGSFALDQSNDFFLPSGTGITEYAASTTALFGTPIATYTAPTGYTLSTAMGVGPTNNLFTQVTQTSTGKISVLNTPYSSGTYNFSSPSYTYGPTGLTDPIVDSTQGGGGIAWILNYGANFVDSAVGSTVTKYTFSTTTDTANGMGLDLHGGPIVSIANANAFYNELASRITGGGLNAPGRVAVDGPQNYWFPNSSACTVSEYETFAAYSGLSSPGGWVNSTGIYIPFCVQNSNNVGGADVLAVDPSGNLWVSLYMPSTTINGTTGLYPQNGGVFQFVGIAQPTKQPLSLQEAAIPTANYDVRP